MTHYQKSYNSDKISCRKKTERPREEGNKTGVSGATVVWFSMGFHGLLNATGRLSVT